MPGEPSLDEGQQELVEKLVAAGYKNHEIAKEIGVPEGTIGRYASDARKKIRDRDQIKETVFKMERTPERLLELLGKMPGIGEAREGIIEMAVKTNPLLMTSPHELFRFLTSTVRLQEGYADIVVKGFFAEVIAQNPTAAVNMFPMFPPTGGGQSSGWPYGPQGGYGAQSQNFQTLQTPSGPVIVPVPIAPGGQALTAADVRRMLDEQRDAEYVEEEAPIIGADGKPVTGPDGKVLIRRTRRPAASAVSAEDATLKTLNLFITLQRLTQPQQPAVSSGDQFMEMVAKLRTLGLVRTPNESSESERIAQVIAQAIQRPERDPLADQVASLTAELRSMKAVEAVKSTYEAQLAQARLEAARAGSGLPAQDQITLKVVEGAMKGVERATDNLDKRLDRAERVGTTLVRAMSPAGQGLPVSFSDQDLQQMAPTPPTPNGVPQPSQT